MGRIRYIKPQFFKDEDIAELNFETRLLFVGLWTLADKAGRLEDRPKRIKAELFPYENVDVEKGLSRLSARKQASGRPFINRYETDGQRFIEIPSWDEHQKPHHTEAESKIPFNNDISLKGNGKGNGDGECPSRESEVKEPLNNGCLPVKIERDDRTLDNVKAYFVSLNQPDEAEKFFDHFSSNGWKVGGRAPMRDWKAAARNWCRNASGFSKRTGITGKERLTQKAAQMFQEVKDL